MLLNRNVIKSNNILRPKYSAFHGIFVHVIHAICAPLVPYSFKIYSPFMASSPQLSGQSIVPRKRSQSGWRSCSGELAVFFFFLLLLLQFFLTYFQEGSFLFRVCMKIKNNIKCLRIPVFLLHYISKGFLFFFFFLFFPFSYTPKLGTVIGMLLNRNVIKLNNTFFVGKQFYSPTTQRSTECLCT